MLPRFFRRNYFSSHVNIVNFFACRVDEIDGVSVAISVRRYSVVFCCQRVGLHEARYVGGVSPCKEVVDVEALEGVQHFVAVKVGIV